MARYHHRSAVQAAQSIPAKGACLIRGYYLENNVLLLCMQLLWSAVMMYAWYTIIFRDFSKSTFGSKIVRSSFLL
jgi:hypothetical protein